MSKRILPFALALCCCIPGAQAADNLFIGKWKLNASKTRLPDEMKIRQDAPNRYGFAFEGDNFAESIVADGTDQPGVFGTTFSVAPEGPSNWKVVRKQDGKVMLTANWKLSEDGNTLQDDFTYIQPDGVKFNVLYVYKRTAAGSGFVGTWDSTSETVKTPFDLQIQAFDGDGLSFITPAEGTTKNLKFDGKDYAYERANINAKFASSLRQVDPLTLEVTDKVNGKHADTQEVKLSLDHKVLTITTRAPGHDKPEIRVFDRE